MEGKESLSKVDDQPPTFKEEKAFVEENFQSSQIGASLENFTFFWDLVWKRVLGLPQLNKEASIEARNIVYSNRQLDVFYIFFDELLSRST